MARMHYRGPNTQNEETNLSKYVKAPLNEYVKVSICQMVDIPNDNKIITKL